MKTLTKDAFAQAERYLQLHGRLIDRLRFEALFGDGSKERVLAALRVYQNPDGGFGNALEPDLRGSGSQPEPVEVAFRLLAELDAFGDPMVLSACDWLTRVTAKNGAVPFALPSVRETPRAPWWQSDDDPPGHLIPTASIAGLLHAHGVEHPWLAPATDFSWTAIAAIEKIAPYEAHAALTFLEGVPDRARAEAELRRLREQIRAVTTFDPRAEGEAHFPLEFAPEPRAFALYAEQELDQHLDALIDNQGEEGGWAASFPMWTPLVAHEWGGFVTVGTLKTLRAYGRLSS